jgi:hypothetical protein
MSREWGGRRAGHFSAPIAEQEMLLMLLLSMLLLLGATEKQ